MSNNDEVNRGENSHNADNDANVTQMRENIPREQAVALGRETVDILRAGYYIPPSANRVDITQQVHDAVRKTETYTPSMNLAIQPFKRSPMNIGVRNATTLQAVRICIEKGFDPVALNFASAETPGGGFLSGARAQEEYLAMSSALWACLKGNEMYAYHRGHKDPFYADYVIYSPNVPVIRDEAGKLLETPYPCSIITSPAVHAHGVRRYMPERVAEIAPVMWTRILKILAVAEQHGHRCLVLGAWGCGAFGNDGNEIAKLFRQALDENFCGAFDYVLFAITDWSEEQRFIGPFLQVFGGGEIEFS